MPERNAGIAPRRVDLSPKARDQLRVAVFDLENGDIIGNMDESAPLLRDFQIVNSLGLPGIDDEKRAVTIGSRLLEQFSPPLDPTRKTITLVPYGYKPEDGVEPVGKVVEIQRGRDAVHPVLPPMRTLGIILSTADNVRGHAVATRGPINHRNLAAGLKRHDALRMLSIAQQELNNEGSTQLDRIDAEFITSAFDRNHELLNLAQKSARY